MTVAELEVALSLRMSQYERDMMEAQKRVEDLEKTADKASKGAADKVERNLARAAQSAKAIGNHLSMYVTAPLVAGGVAMAHAAMDYDEAIAKIRGLDNVPKEMAESWKGAMLSMSGEVGRSPKELADAMFLVAAAGQRGSQALDTLRQSAKASFAGLGETKTVADAVTSAMNAYKSSGLTASRATDILVATVREGKVASEDVAGSMGRVLPLAARMRVSFENVGAAIAVMTRSGLSADEAVTALRGVLAAMVKPGDKAREALKGAHMSAEGFRVELSQNLIKALAHLAEAFKGNDEALGQVFPNIRALIGMLSMTGDQGKVAEGIIKRVTASVNDAGQSFAIMADEPGAKLKMSMEGLNASMIKLGESKTVTQLIETLSKDARGLAHWLDALNDEQRNTILKTALLVAALGPTARAFGGVAIAIKEVIALQTAYAAWAAGTVAETEAVGASAIATSAQLTGLKGLLVGLASKTWVIPVAYLATKPMEYIGKDFLNGIPKAQSADRDALHSAKQNEEFRVGQAWPGVLAKSAGDIRKATEEMVERFGSPGSGEIAASDVRGYIREIVDRGSKNLANSMYGPIGQPKQDHAPIRPVDPFGGASKVVKSGGDNGGGEESDTQKAAREHAEQYRNTIEELTLAVREEGVTEEWRKAIIERQSGQYKELTDAEWKRVYALISQREHLQGVQAATLKAKEATKSFLTSIRETDAQILLARGGLSDLDRVAMARYGKKYGEITGGKAEGDDGLTKQQRQQLVLKDLEKERADKTKETVDWIKEQTLSLQRELDTANLLTETEKVRYEIQQKRAQGAKIPSESARKMLGLAGQQDATAWRTQLSGFGETMAANIQSAVDATTANKQGVKDRLASALQEQSMRLLETGNSADRTKAKLIQLAESMGYGETQAQKIATGMDAAKVAMDAMLKTDEVVAWRQEMADAAKSTEDAFMNAFDSILSGQKSVLGALDDMVAQIAKEALMSSVRSGISGWLGGVFKIPGKAEGGPVMAGHVYQVNENGPELLVPSRNGTVIPADETRDLISRRGGGGQVVNVTVNAADAGSFVQSKRQIASQVARELSAARGRR